MMLTIGGYLNILISFGHIAGLFRAEQMFRLTGVAHQMKELSALHYTLPYALTVFVALVFFVFGLYGLSATKKWMWLPFQKSGIYLISGIYFLRGLGELLADGLSGTSTLTGTFYSIIAVGIAILYLSGGLKLKRLRD
ncbi:hypothetical protein [Pedobacter caeni]|uniref:Uncharacterized protein n=1 Tax=Pedobacter caeni TaxID=288992 RepID=A0A1M5GLF4_9SPHI|nr:hypothetical protein [Pedobacter caeni]SHG04371.1 hypothetical protein SAMN04488522_104263 [Pedobacter caeni]